MVLMDFDALATRCAPNVEPSTLRAMATVESSLNPHAIGIVKGRLSRQPANLPEAISTVMALQKQGALFSAGIVQIYVKNWPAYNLNHETVFDACANLRAASGILTNCYVRAGGKTSDPQVALRKALSCYYSNNFVTGFSAGYVQRVVSAARNFDATARNPARKGF
ncbi:MAG: lytic transglycosylase [Pseudomonas sp.]|nr:MAG: lytic transglycosylase [Pseudomonas sp.]